MIKFAITSEMKRAYPQHTLEKAIHCATRAVIRMELQKTDPIEDYWKALNEQVQIDSLIGEAKQYYCEILTEVLGIENTEDKWKNEWVTFCYCCTANSFKCTSQYYKQTFKFGSINFWML